MFAGKTAVIKENSMLKGWGITFIVFGTFWALAGFLTYYSDIQLGIAVGGLNLVGIGILMLGLNVMGNKTSAEPNGGK